MGSHWKGLKMVMDSHCERPKILHPVHFTVGGASWGLGHGLY